MEEKDAGIPRTSKTRSPSYPVVGLERTIEYARDLHKHAKLHERIRQLWRVLGR